MHTILVADDDEDLLQALDFTLSQNGYNVIQAKDGAETIVEALESKPDLILLDIMMLTAKGEVEDIKAAFKAGANDYVVKPFLMEQVLEKIEEFLVRRAEEKRESDLQEAFDNF